MKSITDPIGYIMPIERQEGWYMASMRTMTHNKITHNHFGHVNSVKGQRFVKLKWHKCIICIV